MQQSACEDGNSMLDGLSGTMSGKDKLKNLKV